MEHARVRILVIDIGGTSVKIGFGKAKEPIHIRSGPEFTPARMMTDVTRALAHRSYDVVSIGYPGPVARGRPAEEPKNLAAGWVRFNYQRAFGVPVRIVNDAAMQALGSYHGGRMLFLGLGTGLGSALVADGVVAPLELAHLPYRKGRTYEEYLGLGGFRRLGRKKWQRHVGDVAEILKHALQVDYVMLGGGQAKKLEEVPIAARIGDNSLAILGGIRLWRDRVHGPMVQFRDACPKPARRVQDGARR